MAKAFALVNIRQMNLNERDVDGGQSIAQYDAGMREACCINDDETNTERGRALDAIDQVAFVIALKALQMNACEFCSRCHGRMNLSQGDRTIYFRLALAQQVEIWSLKHQNLVSTMLGRFFGGLFRRCFGSACSVSWLRHGSEFAANVISLSTIRLSARLQALAVAAPTLARTFARA